MIVLSDPSIVRALAAFNTAWIAIRVGAAIGMYLFSVPVIEAGRLFSSAVMLHQFHYLVGPDAKYLQFSSRVQIISLGTLTVLLYGHPDRDVASRWLYFGAALIVSAQSIWYEIIFVFPVNDELARMKDEVGKKDDRDTDREVVPRVLELLKQWRRRHIERIIIPFVATCFTLYGLSF